MGIRSMFALVLDTPQITVRRHGYEQLIFDVLVNGEAVIGF